MAYIDEVRQLLDALRIKPTIWLDRLTQKLTGQRDFESLVSAGDGEYVPTFCGLQNHREEREDLADEFDDARAERGGPRSHRCHWED